MIQLSSLTKAFGDRVLLRDVTWQIDDGDRVGLCGPNGAGKTTLLRMLAGLEEPDAGAVVKPGALTIGYLPQDGIVHGGRTLVEETSLGLAPLLEMKAEMTGLEARLGDTSVPESEHEAMLVRYAELIDRFRAADGYTMDQRIGTVLQGLGFSREDFDRPTETFSGGWQMRIALAKLLLERPGLLLLDEPTNHLDLEARNWLEEFLVGYPHAVILVSHDRYFLDTVVTRITDLTLSALTDYAGSYSHYLAEHQARMDRLRQAKREQDEEVARVKLFIDRFRYQATKASQVQSRLKMLEKIVPIEVPPERKRVHFTFPASPKSGRSVLELKGASRTYGEKRVFRHVDLLIERGDRVALVGPNGAGKSTLMRMLSGIEPPESGARTEGHQVVMQYFAQDEATRLDPTLTVYETLAAGSPLHMVPAIRTILGGFLFSGDDVYKKVEVLSGGERTRLAVARMLLVPSNTLLLDEPTNHLDLDSKDVLLEALEDFGGTIVLVSHDRYFLDRLATKIIEVGGGEAVVYPGGYEAFRWSQRARATRAGTEQAAPSPARATRKPAPTAPARRPSTPDAPARTRDARKRADADDRRRRREAEAHQRKVADLEARIADRERAMRELEAQMAAPGFYENREASQPVINRHQSLMWEVGDLMHEWEDLARRPPSAETTERSA
jgi:ATP-binding cassette subfamily F protein 3